MTRRPKAFTLVEIIMVIIVLSVLTSLALPRYFKTMEKGREDDARAQLRAIYASEQMYRSRAGSYWPADIGAPYSKAVIDSALGLSIVESGMTFKCKGTNTSSPNGFKCSALRSPSGDWSICVTEAALSETNPSVRTTGDCFDL